MTLVDKIAPHAPGAKLDHDKIQPNLIFAGFPRALKAVAEVATFGARKYSKGGWQHVQDGIERYTNAMERHHLDEAAGEQCDPESGLLHAAHRAWNALAVLELMLREQHAETERRDSENHPVAKHHLSRDGRRKVPKTNRAVTKARGVA